MLSCEIDSITLGVFSSEEINAMSVAEINTTKLSGTGSVYDNRLGCSLNQNMNCITCDKNIKECTGHFGVINFNAYILHPLFYKTIANLLRCFCLNVECSRLKCTREMLELKNIFDYKGELKFTKAVEYLKKLEICIHCKKIQPKISFQTCDSTFQKIIKDKKNKIQIEITTDEIFNLFDSFIDSDIIMIGMNPENCHPRNLILRNFPVIPPCSRPFVMADGNICDDDLTNQLIEIIKCNNKIKEQEICESKKQKLIQALKFRVSTFYNNSNGKSKHTTNGRPIKGIKERLTGKGGQLRSNGMGKRVNFSARTVITPEPTLKLGQVAIPPQIAQNLTYPENVSALNIQKMQRLVDQGRANFVIRTKENQEKININLKYVLQSRGTKLLQGDIIIRNNKKIKVHNRNIELIEGDQLIRNEKQIECIIPSKKKFKLQIGDVLERHLKDGDIVLLNRQPTLHKGSMAAKSIVVREGKTFRFNLASTSQFNADFDGDEMNIHAPQSVEAATELKLLSATANNIISCQSSKPSIVIVQDSLAGAYMMTKDKEGLTKGEFFNIALKGSLKGEELCQPERLRFIRKVLGKFGKKKKIFNGKGLISLILPGNLNYTKKNDGSPEEPIVKIFGGVLYEGVFNKSILGSSHNSLLQVLNKEYGKEVAAEFVDNIQFLTNEWLIHHGFSIGLEDCMVTSKDNQEKIKHVIEKCYVEAEGIEQNTYNPGIKEVRITACLNKAKDVGMRIAKDAFSKDNNFLNTVLSGSKGDFFNIAQITGLLGQQNLRGNRVRASLNNGTRTLVHYPKDGKMNKKLEYESRGFIRHSFIRGLNPKEFFFHAMSGREGICDTAMGTATSGYIQRRMVKLCEDIQVKYDGTVRDANNKIFQFSYGEDGLDPIHLVKMKNNTKSFCNVERLIDRLNLDYVLEKK